MSFGSSASVQSPRVLGGAIASSIGSSLVGFSRADLGAVERSVFDLLVERSVSVKDFGAVGDDTTDDFAAIEYAYNSGAKVVYFPDTPSSRYKIDTGLTPPNGVLLLGSGTGDCRIRYTGIGTGVTLGTSRTVLNKGCGIKDIKIELQDKTSTAVKLVGTNGAKLDNILIEGLYQPYDNTRSNVGVHIDGADVSSFFNTLKDVACTHMNTGFVIQTSGTMHSTCQYFLNCTIDGDQATDDSGYGYRIGDGGTHIQEGQGSVISGGNVEKVNTGFKIGSKAGQMTIEGVRTEIIITGTAWKFDFDTGCEPCTLININGLGSSYMGANSGITGWDTASHTLLGGDDGSLRLGGFAGALNAKNFLGIGGTNPEIRHDANSELYIYSMGDSTDTGRTLIQQGYGSASHGAHIDLSGASHASRAGDCNVGPSSTVGSFKVNQGLNGTTLLEVDRSSTADDVRLLLWDVSAGTLKRVSRGAVDSGGAGYRALRIQN